MAEEEPQEDAPAEEKEAPQPEPLSEAEPAIDEVEQKDAVTSAETFVAEFEQLPVLDMGELEKFVSRYDDVPVKVSIELGRITKTLNEILEWREGSVVETEKLSGMPMEIMVNGSMFGHGEVVVVGDNLAIRITDLEKPNLE